MRKHVAEPVIDDEGEGEPVVLIHGLGASATVFSDIRTALRGEHRLLTVELPCCARAKSWSRMLPHEVAQALVFALRARNVHRPFVVGHSFGGVVALELAALEPNLRGVLCASAPAMGLGSLKSALSSPLADWTMRIATKMKPSAAAVRAYLSFIWGAGPPPTPGHVQGYLMAMEAEGHHAATLEALRSLADYTPPKESLARHNVPLLLLWGDRDKLVPVSHGDRLSRELGAPLRILRGAGHCLPEERPEAIVDLVRLAHGRAALESA